jgi:hypothetical protein
MDFSQTQLMGTDQGIPEERRFTYMTHNLKSNQDPNDSRLTWLHAPELSMRESNFDKVNVDSFNIGYQSMNESQQ